MKKLCKEVKKKPMTDMRSNCQCNPKMLLCQYWTVTIPLIHCLKCRESNGMGYGSSTISRSSQVAHDLAPTSHLRLGLQHPWILVSALGPATSPLQKLTDNCILLIGVSEALALKRMSGYHTVVQHQNVCTLHGNRSHNLHSHSPPQTCLARHILFSHLSKL